MKILLLSLALLGILARSYFVYQTRQLHAARQTVSSVRQITAQVRGGQGSPDAAADAAARGVPPPPAAGKAPAAAPGGPTVNVNGTARGEVEAALRLLHVTTIMPGPPGVFILNNDHKHDYSEGDDLPLPGGRRARVVAVQDDGVQLTCEGMAFHLDAPAAPDLAALRKGR